MRKTNNSSIDSHFTKQPRGATTVEMAIVAPLLFLLIFGLVEFTRMSMVKQALTDAARLGCRKAVLANTIIPADPEATVRNHLQSTMSNSQDVSTCRVTISPSNLNGMASGTEITTTVEVNYSDVSWIIPSFLGSTVLQGQTTMKRE